MKKALLASVLVALSAGVWFVLDSERHGSLPVVPEASEGTPSVAAGIEAPPPASEPVQREAVDPVLPPQTEETSPSPSPPDALEIHGTITLMDETGIEHPAEDGTFVLWQLTADEGVGQPIDVTAGRWEAVVPIRTESGQVRALGVGQVVLGSRSAVLVDGPESTYPIPKDQTLAVRVRRLPSVLLHVQDEETGRELDAVQVLEPARSEGHDHPGRVLRSEIRELGASPVLLTPPDQDDRPRRTYFARSPGHAWGRIEVDLLQEGERLLQLPPGGTLGVSVLGRERDPGTFVRVHRQGPRGDSVLYECELADRDEISIESLAVGPCEVRAEIGNWWDHPLILSKAKADIPHEGRAEVTLILETPPTTPFVPLEGSLVLPAEWEADGFLLTLKLLGTPLGGMTEHLTIHDSETTRVADDTYHWNAGLVQPGRYELGLYDPPFAIVLEVGPSGEHDARLIVPPPCQVSVRCVDDTSGEDASLDGVSWHCTRPWSKGWTSKAATFDPATSRWEFRPPQGSIELEVSDPRYEDVRKMVQVGPGDNELELRLRRTIGITLILKDGDAELPWNVDQIPKLVTLEGQGRYSGWMQSRGRFMFRTTGPGLFKVTLDAIPGYEDIPEQTVRLERGVMVEHVIELKRKF